MDDHIEDIRDMVKIGSGVHRLPVHAGIDAVQGTEAAGQQQRMGAAGAWHPG
ncbi:MAG: hypothetical protein WC913_06485 [Desulfuromonas sp.]